MNRCILNAVIAGMTVVILSPCFGATFSCPTLKANQLYFYYDWIDDHGSKYTDGEWNKQYWRLWVNGDSYLTPQFEEVITAPLAAHYFASTNTWYLKCISADLSIGPRNNVWTYSSCSINPDNTAFVCQ